MNHLKNLKLKINFHRKEVTELELNILFKQLKELHIDDVKHSTLEILNYKNIVREMEFGKRSGYIPMLKFTQLTICYHFDYTKYLTGKRNLLFCFNFNENKNWKFFSLKYHWAEKIITNTIGDLNHKSIAQLKIYSHQAGFYY